MISHLSRDTTVQLNPSGLSSLCSPQIHRLGHQGSRLVYRADGSQLRRIVDPSSGLTLFPIEDVFLDRNSVLLGCGTPNAAISVYRNDGERGADWYKFAAFMFWRQAAYVAPAKGRLQAGLYLELRNLSDDVREAIWQSMHKFAGQRGPSCARLNAEVLADAGFTLGNGKSLKVAVRPSKYASLLWQHGISYRGTSVDARIVLASEKGVGDHLRGTWLKEASSPARTVRKLYAAGSSHAPAPVFAPHDATTVSAPNWHGTKTTVGVNRPSRLGVNLSYLIGQQPIYTVELPGIDACQALGRPMQPFPGTLDRLTKLKKNVLFSRPVIGTIRHFRNRSADYFHNIPASAAIDMLTYSRSAAYDSAVLYNCVVTKTSGSNAEARITPLRNDEVSGRSNKFVKTVNWILAKHVLISGYDPGTLYACELWSYERDGQRVLCINDNSGTYKPTAAQMQAFAAYLSQLSGSEVETHTIESN